MNEERKNKAHLLVKKALDDLADSLESGRSQNLEEFLRAMGRFHRYSLHNVALITAQNPEATRVAGYRTWQSLGRQVRKGERGIVILVPMVFRKNPDDPNDSDESRERRASRRENRENESALGFGTGTVFDEAQTEGSPLPEIGKVRGDPGRALARLRLFYEKLGIALTEVASLGGAVGVSRGGRVEIVSGLPPAQEFAVLVHELAHETMHRNGRSENLTRKLAELEAEAVSYAVCRGIGLDPGTASADYIQLYRGDVASLADSLAAIQRAASDVLTWLDR
ncbi:MAG: DUF1738 domain-containing protein [Fimbriimonadaceae bacterium]|nr:DUF1738 domain-containing protein [Fimbriimonadaceae bacterium]